MAEPVRWEREPHTAAKHRVLRAYIDGWIPVMARLTLKQQERLRGEPRVLLVDGFAGPGRYRGGEPGSPLIMLEALLDHRDFGELADVGFRFFFVEQHPERFQALRDEIAGLGDLPANVEVSLRCQPFAEAFDEVVTEAEQDVPTFAFIDPFGFSQAPLSVTGRLFDLPRCEALYFLPLTPLARFVDHDDLEAVYTSLYRGEDWRQARALSGDERKLFLLRLFEEQLEKNRHVEYVRSFQLRTLRGHDYRLVFAVGHEKGLVLAKDAMWKVDPVAGTSFVATTAAGQEVLFSSRHVDTGPLLKELRARFGTEWFTVRQAVRCTLEDTPFRLAHLRKMTLRPALKEGTLISEPPDARALDASVRLRFTS